VNSFEIAIMRILIKRQKPIPISHVAEGFPNDSEDFVLEAIRNLLNSGYIFCPYIEKSHITYNREKRREILRIIDPLPEYRLEKEEEKELSVDRTENYISASHNSKNDGGRWYHAYTKHGAIRKIALVTSMLVFGIVIIFSTAISTEDVYQDFKSIDTGYYYHHDNYPLFKSKCIRQHNGESTVFTTHKLKTKGYIF
jgi:hypothetical protein